VAKKMELLMQKYRVVSNWHVILLFLLIQEQKCYMPITNSCNSIGRIGQKLCWAKNGLLLHNSLRSKPRWTL